MMTTLSRLRIHARLRRVQRAPQRRSFAALGLPMLLAALALLLAGCEAQAGQWRTIGPDDGAHVFTVAADPHVAGLIYAGADDGSVYRVLADQSGRVVSGSGIPRGAAVASVLPDPAHAGVVFAATSAGLYRSATYGDQWSAYSSGLPSGQAQIALAASPDDATLLLGIDHGGLYRSVNEGASWASAAAGLPAQATPVALTWDAPDHLWLAGLVGGTGDALYASADGGQTWAPRATGLPAGAQVNALAALPGATAPDSASSPTLFAATTAGLFSSANSGQRWARVGGLPTGSALALATFIPQPTWVYVSVAASVYRSTDAGAHWQTYSGGLTSNAQALAVTQGKTSGPVVYVAAGQVARYPTGISGGGNGGFPADVALGAFALALLAGGYWVSRRSRRFGYSMGARRNERNTGRTAEAAARWNRERQMLSAPHETPDAPGAGGRRGPFALRSGRRVLAPSDLTSRSSTGAPADEGKAAQNGHGKPEDRG